MYPKLGYQMTQNPQAEDAKHKLETSMVMEKMLGL